MPDDGIRVAAVNLAVLRDRATAAAGPSAAEAMASHGKQVDREVLTLRQHPAHTHTPSPPGAPPAMITGALAADIGSGDAHRAGTFRWEAHAGPTRDISRSKWGPTGRFLELGGTHYAHTARGMRWLEDGRWHGSRRHPIMEISKLPRPYLVYALRVMIADGSLRDAAITGFSDAMGF